MADSNPVPSERGRVGITIRSNENIVPAALVISAANRLIGEVVQSRRRPLLGPSPC